MTFDEWLGEDIAGTTRLSWFHEDVACGDVSLVSWLRQAWAAGVECGVSGERVALSWEEFRHEEWRAKHEAGQYEICIPLNRMGFYPKWRDHNGSSQFVSPPRDTFKQAAAACVAHSMRAES